MRIAPRDASAYSSHRQTTGRSTLDHVPRWHVIKPDEPYLSRCGRLIDPTMEDAPSTGRLECGRPGCKQAWERWHAERSATEESGNEGGDRADM